MRAISELCQKARTLLGGKERKVTTRGNFTTEREEINYGPYSSASTDVQYTRWTAWGETVWNGNDWRGKRIAKLFGYSTEWWKVAIAYYAQLHPMSRHYSWEQLEDACNGWPVDGDPDTALHYALEVKKFFDENPQYADLVLPAS